MKIKESSFTGSLNNGVTAADFPSKIGKWRRLFSSGESIIYELQNGAIVQFFIPKKDNSVEIGVRIDDFFLYNDDSLRIGNIVIASSVPRLVSLFEDVLDVVEDSVTNINDVIREYEDYSLLSVACVYSETIKNKVDVYRRQMAIGIQNVFKKAR